MNLLHVATLASFVKRERERARHLGVYGTNQDVDDPLPSEAPSAQGGGEDGAEDVRAWRWVREVVKSIVAC